jgi:hypothetical protein
MTLKIGKGPDKGKIANKLYCILNLASCSEHFISIKHRILATFNINKKINSDSMYAFNYALHLY